MKRLDRIVRNFLRFSRTPQLRLQRLSINDVVRHVFELVSPEAREQGVRLILDLLPDLPLVDGDESQLGQAVLNMAVNAFQSIEKGGEVCAKTRVDAQLGQICLSLSDTGCGIPEAEIDRILADYGIPAAPELGKAGSYIQTTVRNEVIKNRRKKLISYLR